MKKILSIFFLFLSFNCLFALEKEYDFVEIDFDEIIKDESNWNETGDVMKTGRINYHTDYIDYKIFCNIFLPDRNFIFFSSNNKEILSDFYEEYIQTYINRSYEFMRTSMWNENGIEPVYYFYLDKKPIVLIYSKMLNTNGLMGFGVKYGKKIDYLGEKNYFRIVYENDNYHKYRMYRNEKPLKLETETIYYNGFDFEDEGILTFEEFLNFDNYLLMGNVSIILETKKRNYKLRIVCEDESILNDPYFGYIQLKINQKDFLNFYNLIEIGHDYEIKTGDITKFSIEIYTRDKKKIEYFETIANKFYLEIKLSE